MQQGTRTILLLEKDISLKLELKYVLLGCHKYVMYHVYYRYKERTILLVEKDISLKLELKYVLLDCQR